MGGRRCCCGPTFICSQCPGAVPGTIIATVAGYGELSFGYYAPCQWLHGTFEGATDCGLYGEVGFVFLVDPTERFVWILILYGPGATTAATYYAEITGDCDDEYEFTKFSDDTACGYPDTLTINSP